MSLPVVADVAAPDRRRRRWLATHEAIRRAALELVAGRGLDEVSVEMIADRADVGYRTFFNHFPTKEDALVEPGEPRAAQLTALLNARPVGEDPLESLRVAVTDSFDDFEDRRSDICTKLSVIEANPVLIPRFHEEFVVMERAIADAVARRIGLDAETDLYPHLLAAVAGTALRTCMMRWRAAGSVGSPRALVIEAFDALSRGLTPPPVSRRLA